MRAKSQDTRNTSRIRYCEATREGRESVREIIRRGGEQSTYPRVEGGEVRGHVPEIRSLGANVFLEFQSMEKHGDGSCSSREDEHEVDMTDLGWSDAIKESDEAANEVRLGERGRCT
jgi:hypothetical protein